MPKFKKFVVGRLFRKLDIAPLANGVRQQLVTKTKDPLHSIPLTAAKLGDGGVMYWGNSSDFKTAENCLVVVYDGAVSAGSVYPHEGPVGVFSHSYIIKSIEDVPFEATMYMATAMHKAIYPKYSRDNPSRWNKVKEDAIMLPVRDNGRPDYDYMTSYIMSLKLECIQNIETFLHTQQTTDY